MPRCAGVFLLAVSSMFGCSNQVATPVSPKGEIATPPPQWSTAYVIRADAAELMHGDTQSSSVDEDTVQIAWDGEFLGGARVQVKTGAELQAVIARQQANSYPLTIVIQSTISRENSPNQPWIDVRDVTNLSIVGAGAGVEFNQIGLRLTRANNIVLRRLHVPFVQIGEDDAISLEGHVDHAWIDHSETTADHEDVGKQYHGTVVSPHDEGVPLLAEPDDAHVTGRDYMRAHGLQRTNRGWV